MALVSLIYNCYDVVDEYYNYPTALIVRMEDPKEMDFPAITICVLLKPKHFHYQNQKMCVEKTQNTLQPLSDINNDNKQLPPRTTGETFYESSKKNVNHLYRNLSIVKGSDGISNFNLKRGNENNADGGNGRRFQAEKRPLTGPRQNGMCDFEFEKHIKYNGSAQETILICSFDLNECYYSDFKEWESEDYGKCYTFSGVRTTTKFGSTSGLHLVIKVTHTDPNIRTSGIRTIVHSPNEFPFPEDDGINVPRCMLADIAIMKEEIERLQPPHGNCTTNTAIPHWEEMFGELPYSRQGCIKACHSQKVLDQCNCTLNIRIGKSLRGDVIHCRQHKDKEDCSENVISGADCECNPACSEETFDTSVSYSQFVFEENCPEKISCGNSTCYTKKLPCRDIMGIHVYYKDLTFEKKTQTPTYTTPALIANIGGTLGLCLGLSLVTIVEVIELILDMLMTCFRSSSDVKPVNLPRPKTETKQGDHPNLHQIRVTPYSVQVRQIAMEDAPERNQQK
ncbi:degenerin unc-8-like [Centruroides sculpturatus]|uniref:degenerin unc-8-like n=1 Tax=Centruroides sculpturatus TaxID=218467 RepID=UPI000C6D751C|nr:degenerin unc-8-like [Centruroides sculpturatus]